MSQRTLNVDFSDTPDGWVLPEGDAKRGALLFKKHCLQCHSIYPDNRVTSTGQMAGGPTLWNVWNRASGSETLAGRHTSGKMKDLGIVWNDLNLMKYMKNPHGIILGKCGMNFFGIPDLQTRVDIVHYLHTLTPDDPYGQQIMKEKNTMVSDFDRWLSGKKD